MRSFAIRRPFATYYCLALAIAMAVMTAFFALTIADPSVVSILPALSPWLKAHQLFTNVYGILRFAADGHAPAVLILVFALAPSVAALITSFLTGGSARVRRLVARFKPFQTGADRRRALVAYAAVGGLYILGLTVFAGAMLRWGMAQDAARAAASLGGTPLAIIAMLVIAPFLDEGGLLEELGWRGFALPRLQATLPSPLIASIWLGILWMSWHLPREIPTLLAGPNLGNWAMGQAQFAVLTVSLSVIAAWLVNRCGGSILPAIALHGGTNVWSKALGAGAAASGIDIRIWIIVPLAVAVAVFAGHNLGLTEAARADINRDQA